MDKLKRYIIFFNRTFYQFIGRKSNYESRTWHFSNLFHSLCIEPNFSFFTLGQFTIYFSVLLVVLQLLILRRKFKVEHLLQIPISIAFGYFIDLTMEMLSLSIRNCILSKLLHF